MGGHGWGTGPVGLGTGVGARGGRGQEQGSEVGGQWSVEGLGWRQGSGQGWDAALG